MSALAERTRGRFEAVVEEPRTLSAADRLGGLCDPRSLQGVRSSGIPRGPSRPLSPGGGGGGGSRSTPPSSAARRSMSATGSASSWRTTISPPPGWRGTSSPTFPNARARIRRTLGPPIRRGATPPRGCPGRRGHTPPSPPNRRGENPPPFGPADPPGRDPAAGVPEAARQVYDVRGVIDALVDGGTMLEVSERWGRNRVTAFCRIDGRSVGVIANQPWFLGGVIDAAAAQKAAKFVRICNSYGLPLVVLVDTPGFLPGTKQEGLGVIRHGAKLLHAFAEAVVPKV